MKKIISCLVLCAMLLSVFSLCVFAEENTQNTFVYGGASDDYTLTTVEDLKAFNAKNATDKITFTGTVTLAKDAEFDLSDYTWVVGGTFNGTFDGNGATIKNLSISGSISGSAMFMHAQGTIKDFTVDTVNVDTTASHVGVIVGGPTDAPTEGLTISGVTVVNATVKGKQNVGGIIGNANRLKENNSKVTISNCSFVGSVTASSQNVGGILGYAVNADSLEITDCYVKGNISNTNTTGSNNQGVGGIVGRSNISTTISGCTCDAVSVSASTNGNYVGGAIGFMDGNIGLTVSDTVVTGTVNAPNKGGAGLIAMAQKLTSIDIARCYINVTLQGAGNHKGGIIGRNNATNANVTVNISDCLVEGSINSSTSSNIHLAGIIAWMVDQNGNARDLKCENVIVNVSSDHANFVAFAGYDKTDSNKSDDSVCAYTNVYYNSESWSGTDMFNTYHGTPDGTAYGAKTNDEIEALNLEGWNNGMPVTLTYTDTKGYQCKDNGDETVTYRIVGTLTLPDGKTLDDIADIGFYVMFTYNNTKVMQKVSCVKVYSSILGGGITYYPGEKPADDTDEFHEYLGGDYIFVAEFEPMPDDVTLEYARFTSYTNVSETAGYDAYHGVTRTCTLSKNL